MKRSVWKVLAVLMALAVFSTTMASAAGSDKFTDVPSDSWYKQYVDFVVDNGYMNGVSSTKFAPNDNLTRAMFATILARYDGATVDNSKATAFSDVAVNQWYTGSIAWANEKGIVKGTGSGKFSPEANITRQDLCVMVERYITYVESTTDKVHVTPGVAKTFTDEGQIASYAKSAMDKAVIHGLIFGYPDGSVRPTQNITRAECAAIISRIAWKEGDGKESHEMTIYDAKGNVQETVTVKAGDTFTVPQGPAKDNATFKGWNTSKDGSGTTYQPGDKILLTSDMPLYPQYEEAAPPVIPGGGGGGGGGGETPTTKDITITEYDDKGNVIETKTITVSLTANTYPAPATPESVPDFVGWKDGAGNFYKPGDQIPVSTTKLIAATKVYYDVTIGLETAGFSMNQIFEFSQTYEKDTTIDQVAKDLAANADLKAKIGEGLKAFDGTKHYVSSGNTYTVNMKYSESGTVITVTDNNESVDLVKFVEKEQKLFEDRSKAVILAAGVANGSDVYNAWIDFTKTFSPKKYFTDIQTNTLTMGSAEYYTTMFKNAADKAAVFHEKAGTAFDYSKLVGDNGIIKLDVAADYTNKIMQDADGLILADNVGGPVTIFNQTVKKDASISELKKIINDRTNRAYTASDTIANAILDAAIADKTIFGDYTLTFKIAERAM